MGLLKLPATWFGLLAVGYILSVHFTLYKETRKLEACTGARFDERLKAATMIEKAEHKALIDRLAAAESELSRRDELQDKLERKFRAELNAKLKARAQLDELRETHGEYLDAVIPNDVFSWLRDAESRAATSPGRGNTLPSAGDTGGIIDTFNRLLSGGAYEPGPNKVLPRQFETTGSRELPPAADKGLPGRLGALCELAKQNGVELEGCQ